MRAAVLAGLGLAVVLGGGCAREVRITSEPVRARVLLDGAFAGYTPLELRLGSRVRRIALHSPGHRSVSGVLKREFDPRALAWILVPPALLLPGVNTRLAEHYRIVLEPGDDPVDRGVVHGAPADDP